jgi:hypothetical protein
VRQDRKGRKANKDCKARRATKVTQAQPAHRDQKVIQEISARKDRRELLVQLGHKALRALTARLF